MLNTTCYVLQFQNDNKIVGAMDINMVGDCSFSVLQTSLKQTLRVLFSRHKRYLRIINLDNFALAQHKIQDGSLKLH